MRPHSWKEVICGVWKCDTCELTRGSLTPPDPHPQPVIQEWPGGIQSFWGYDMKSCDEVLFTEVIES